jgi:hypothetical protein
MCFNHFNREESMFGFLNRRRPEPRKQRSVYVDFDSIVGARFVPPSADAREAAAVADFKRAMSTGLRQPGGPVRRSVFSSKPSRPGTGL